MIHSFIYFNILLSLLLYIQCQHHHSSHNNAMEQQPNWHYIWMHSPEFQYLEGLKPMKYSNDYYFFWRPQKVASSTIVSILVSHGFRYNIVPTTRVCPNSFCIHLAQCANYTFSSQNNHDHVTVLNKYIYQQPCGRVRDNFHISVNHEICNLPASWIQQNMQCAFQNIVSNTFIDPIEVKKSLPDSFKLYQFIPLRDPISRIISVYYHYGEESKRNKYLKSIRENLTLNYDIDHPNNYDNAAVKQMNIAATLWKIENEIRLGSSVIPSGVSRGRFEYHGNESSLPPTDIANMFANVYPLREGADGPSLTWSLYSNSIQDAIDLISNRTIFPLVIERMDESLVLFSKYLKWTLADVIVTLNRKALSAHPKYTLWPNSSLSLLKERAYQRGEYGMYNVANKVLDDEIEKFGKVPFEEELQKFYLLRNHSTKLCSKSSKSYLYYYGQFMENHGLQVMSTNTLREVDENYIQDGHLSFTFNAVPMFASDLCGSCEAHLLLLVLDGKLKEDDLTDTSGNHLSINDLSLQKIDKKFIIDNVDFHNCPRHFQP